MWKEHYKEDKEIEIGHGTKEGTVELQVKSEDEEGEGGDAKAGGADEERPSVTAGA